MKILLVEDNSALSERIKHKLVEQHYVVDAVASGEEALELVKTIAYGLIILDLGLPGMSGDIVCKAMRDQGVMTPILILTGTNTTQSKVRLLDSGADDYLTKPFNSNELRARVAALTRRKTNKDKPVARMHIAGLDINRDARTVYRGEEAIELRRKEFDILTYLIDNNGRVVTRNMIAQHIWDTATQDNDVSSIDVHITTLRNRIDRPFNTTLIKTVYGLGYKVDVPQE